MKLTAADFEPEIKALFNKMIDATGPYDFQNSHAFMILFIFNTMMSDLMWQMQEMDKMPLEDRLNMAEDLGYKIRDLMRVYTNKDSRKLI